MFKELQLPQSELIVAGEIYDTNLKNRLVALANQGNIKLNMKFIPDDEVQRYFNTADVVVCPYKAIENSSTILLSASFKKPTIFPDIGSLKHYPEELGFKYSHTSGDGLLSAMKKAYASKDLVTLGENSYKYVKKFDWEILARKMHDVYKDVNSG